MVATEGGTATSVPAGTEGFGGLRPQMVIWHGTAIDPIMVGLEVSQPGSETEEPEGSEREPP